MDLATRLKNALSNEQLTLLHTVVEEASALGFPIYMVGGSVRDLVLGRRVNDFDLTVEGDAITLGRALVKKHGGKLTAHEKFGTGTWFFREAILDTRNLTPESQISNIEFLDLISARKETYSHPGALPTAEKSTIEDDLRRRDFTVNAMAIRLDVDHFGELYDPLNGGQDLENKLIRVLHPKSFVDDPTRMFRAVRYAARYGFSIESGTRQALFDQEARRVLSQLSGERIRHEFDLIFEENKPLFALAVLEDAGVPKDIHPAFEKTRAMSLSYLGERPEGFGEFAIPDILSFKQTLGWILLLMILTKAEIESIAERLAFPALLTDTVKSASALMKDLPSFKDWKSSQWALHLDELPSLAVYAVYLENRNEYLREYLAKWQHVKPHTTGDDLKQRGLEPGPRFGEILRQLRAAWLDGEVKTEEEERLLLDRLVK